MNYDLNASLIFYFPGQDMVILECPMCSYGFEIATIVEQYQKMNPEFKLIEKKGVKWPACMYVILKAYSFELVELVIWFESPCTYLVEQK